MAEVNVEKEPNASVVSVDEKVIDAAVIFINETANKIIYQGSIEIGKYVLEHFFGGDTQLAFSKDLKNHESFNRLCEHPDLLINPARLVLMVRVASQEQYLADENINMDPLFYTHKVSLVKLNNDSKKKEIIKNCIQNNWSTRKLDSEIKKIIQQIPSRTNPSLITTTKKYITKIGEILKTLDHSKLHNRDVELSRMPKKRQEDLENYLNELKSMIEETVKISGEISKSCDNLLSQLTKTLEEKKVTSPKPRKITDTKK